MSIYEICDGRALICSDKEIEIINKYFVRKHEVRKALQEFSFEGVIGDGIEVEELLERLGIR